MSEEKLTRAAIVTGGSRGIGRAVCVAPDCGYRAAKEGHTWKNRAEYIRECYLDE